VRVLCAGGRANGSVTRPPTRGRSFTVILGEQLPDLPEPEDGLVPLGFSAAAAESMAATLPSQEIVPSRFSRPFLRADYPAEMKVMSLPQLQAMNQARTLARPHSRSLCAPCAHVCVCVHMCVTAR
jgi:hypothetical protein